MFSTQILEVEHLRNDLMFKTKIKKVRENFSQKEKSDYTKVVSISKT